METFLFWNINRRQIESLIVRLVHDHNVDVLMLAESQIADIELLNQLNSSQKSIYSLAPGIPTRLRIYTRYSLKFVKPIKDSRYVSIRQLTFPLHKDVLLVVAHLASKLYQDEDDQILDCTSLARDIKEAEQIVGHSRTILVGDLNMNPFESGVVGAAGFHAVMDRSIAQRGSRQVHDNEYPFFYNPMWGYLGDVSPGPPGTFYYDTGTQVNFFWNMFDQVLIRPELLCAFQTEELKVLTEVGSHSLLTSSGKPDIDMGSDHLPILFRLNLLKEV